MCATQKNDPVHISGRPRENHQANSCRKGHPGHHLQSAVPTLSGQCSLQMRKPGSSRITWQVVWTSVLLSQPPSLELPPGASFHLFTCLAEGWSSSKLPSIPFSLHSDSLCFPSTFKYLLSTYCVLGPMMGRGDTSALWRWHLRGERQEDSPPAK